MKPLPEDPDKDVFSTQFEFSLMVEDTPSGEFSMREITERERAILARIKEAVQQARKQKMNRIQCIAQHLSGNP